MNHKPVTLKDVAEHSDYSLRTVKKVMSGDKSVRPETRENVLNAAKELGYKKNIVASVLARNKVTNVAVILGDYRFFFPEAKRGFESNLRGWLELKVNIEFLIPADKTLEASKELLRNILKSEKYDAVIMHASSMEGLNEEIDALVDDGIAVCTYGADAPGSKRLFYVGPRAYESGRIAAQVMANYIRKTGSVYILNPAQKEMQALERVRGVLEYMQEIHPEIEIEQIFVEQGADEYHDKVAELMKRPDVAGIIGTDADSYIIGEEARKVGRKDIISVGFDLSSDSAALMREGYFKVLLDQKPEQQAALALDGICRYLIYQTKVKNVFTDVVIVTSEVLRYKDKECD